MVAQVSIQLLTRRTMLTRLSVILVQAENEFSAGGSHDSYMQNIIDIYRNNGIAIRKSCSSHKSRLSYGII